MRRDSRVLAFSLVFERQFNSNPVDDELWDNLKESERDYAKQIFLAWQQNKDEIENEIKNLVVGYEFSRLHKVELSLIMIAIAEIKYLKTPPAVVINEAVEIAKIYSSLDGAKFLNGVLSAYLKKGTTNA